MPRNPIDTLARLERQLESRVGRVLTRNANRIKNKLRADQPLKPRSGRGFPYLSRPARWEGGRLIARVFSPVSWAKVHIGPRGSATTITPTRGRYLAIPTDFVRKFRGHPVGPKQYASGYKVIIGGVIFARAGGARGTEGIKQRRAAGEKLKRSDLVPLFILKGSVVIRRRIHPELYRAWIKPHLLADLKKEVLKVP